MAVDNASYKYYLFAGRDNKLKNPSWSEACLRLALKLSEESYGADSASAGLCLIELADLMEKEGRFDEAEFITARYRYILLTHAQRLGIGPKAE